MVVVVSIETFYTAQAEFGLNGHREEAPLYNLHLSNIYDNYLERDERDRKLVCREAFFNLMYSEKPISDLKTCMKKLNDGNTSHQKCTKKERVQ